MKKIVMVLLGSFLLVLSAACGKSEVEAIKHEEAKAKEGKLKVREEKLIEKEEEMEVREEEFKEKDGELEGREEEIKVKEEALEGKEKEFKAKEEAKLEEINAAVNDFDNLPLSIKVHLATSVVDWRADEHDLTGFTLYYNIVGDELFVNVHSGAGTGHPIFKIKMDSDSIEPIDGLVSEGAGMELEELDVNTVISKEDLYQKYTVHKNIYDAGQSNIEEDAGMTTEKYEWMKNNLYEE